MKIIVVTSRTAEKMIRGVLERSRSVREGRAQVEVLALPVPAIGVLTARGLARLLERERDRLAGADLVLVPGGISGDVSEASSTLGVPVVKASRDAGLLPLVLDYVVEGGDLSTRVPAEEYLRVEPEPVWPRTAYTLQGLRVPVRGPPIVLAAEIPPRPPRPPRDMAEDYVAEGAGLVVVGFDGSDLDVFAGRLHDVVDAVDVPVVAEAPSVDAAMRAVEAGAVGLSVSAGLAEALIGRVPRDTFILVGERDPDDLARAVAALSRAGYSRVAVDPVVGVPMVDLADTAVRYKAVEPLGLPIWFSAANAANMVDADTHGVYALLAVLAAELGASFFLVVEDEYKTRHSVAEAREALRLAEAAWLRGRPPGGIGSRLFVVKQPAPPPPPTLTVEGAVIVEGPVEPRMEKGHFVVDVDHERGLIIVEYREAGRSRRWAGRRARHLARAVLREVGVSGEHAAYLGEELYKAELALRFGRSYVQDEDVIVPIWEEG